MKLACSYKLCFTPFLVLQELAKISHDDEEEEADDEDLDQHSRHFLKYAKQIREMKVCKVMGKKAGICDGVPSTTALVGS